MKKFWGIVLILLGVLALLTPFTPGSWLAFIGLSILGVNVSFWEKIKAYYRKIT